MKKISVIFMILFTAFFFAACAADEEEEVTGDDVNNGENEGNSGNDGENHGGEETGDNEQADADQDPVNEGGIYVTCTPGETRSCYDGPSGTEGVGVCKAGVATCVEDGTDWSECIGQVTPQAEICSNGIDENCDGEDMTPENAEDYDGDGYNYCNGDCCETGWETNCRGTDSPERINAGAYEMKDNYVDDNCNGQVDEVEHCDAGLSLAIGDYAGNAEKLAKAMGVCAGLVSAELSLAGEPITEMIDTNPEPCTTENGNTSCNYNPQPRLSRDMPYYESDYQTFAVTNMFGTAMVPEDGSNMLAVLSTGQWNSPTQNASVATLGAGDMQTASKLPSDWLNMMPGCQVPKAPSCGGQAPQDGLTNQCAGKSDSDIPVGQDPIMLTLKMKVPANARAFEFSLFFMSIEYPSTVCSKNNYNDFFIALLDSTYNEKNPTAEYKNPYDKNLAKDDSGNPVGVDLAPAGLFKACNPSCNNALTGNLNKWGACENDILLNGTGFGTEGKSGVVGCAEGHGGTGWLRVVGNVEPNEEITLRLVLFEQGILTDGYGPDHSWDSTVVLDGFQWLPTPKKPGVSPK
ncbi:hypothetical protein IJG44_04115 [bacterium]|nr:hypothetical protein [bacterium]